MKTNLFAGIVALFLFKAGTSHAQFISYPNYGAAPLISKQYADVQGSPFLYPSWKPGSVTDGSNKEFPNQLLKYDTHKDEVQINREGTTMILSNAMYPAFQIAFTDEESTSKTQRLFRTGFAIEGYPKTGYFEVLFDGKYKFLKKTKTDFMDQNVNTYGSANSVKRFITKIKYFIVDKSGKSFEIRLSKKSLLDALGDDKPAAEVYLAKSGNKVKDEQAVIEILKSFE
jgi:hypothetical protein